MQLIASKVFYQSHAITILYDEALGLGKGVWRGSICGHDLREATLLCVHAMEKYDLKFWLADNRKMKSIREEDNMWVKENIVPTLAMGRLEKLATLVSEDVENAEAVRYLYEGADKAGYLLMQDFNDEQQALEWLLAGK